MLRRFVIGVSLAASIAALAVPAAAVAAKPNVLVARPTASSPAKLEELRKLALELKSCKGKACVR